MSCKKIGIISFKGGVAKTSSAVNIAAGIKNKNPEAKILLVDADPQGSVRSYFQLRLKDKADFGSVDSSSDWFTGDWVDDDSSGDWVEGVATVF